MPNTKNPTTYQEQMTLLKTRGCVIPDEDVCLNQHTSTQASRYVVLIR